MRSRDLGTLVLATMVGGSVAGIGTASAQSPSDPISTGTANANVSNSTLGPPSPPLPKEHRPTKNYVRALEEYAFISGVFGIPWYWGNQDFSQRNWDLKWDWDSWKRKAVTFDAVRFDGDDFQTNAFKHPFLSGTADFLIARTNHLAIPESLLLASLNSIAWEYLVEFREKPSLNDMIATPFAGMAIGEVIFQLGEFFHRGGDQPINWTLANTVGGLQGLHARMDNREMPKSPGVDALGFPLDRWHRFVLSAGIAHAWVLPRNETRMELGLDTEIVTVRTWEKPGRVHRFIGDEGFSRLTGRLALNEAGLQRGLVRFRATLGGYYDQDLEGTAGGDLTGHALFAGVHASFEYSQTHWGEVHDRMAIMSIFGLGTDAMLHLGPLTVRAALDVAPEFAMVSALAGHAYVDSLGPEGRTKTALQQHNYYYSLGIGVAPSLRVELLPFFVGAEARLQQFRSIEGLERGQSTLTSDEHLRDRRLSYRAYLGLRPIALLQFTVAAEQTMREGDVAGHHASMHERTVTVGAAFNL
jgi:hypothetical protein